MEGENDDASSGSGASSIMGDDDTSVVTTKHELEILNFISQTVSKFSKGWSETLLSSLDTQFGDIKEAISDVNKNIGTLEESLCVKVKAATTAAAEAKKIANANTVAIRELRCEINNIKKECVSLKEENKSLKAHCNNIESYSRRDNLVFYGIKEVAHESNEQCIALLRDFMKTRLQIDEERVNSIKFVRCHRLNSHHNIKPIIARFREYEDREHVWHNLDKLPKRGQQYVTEDYSKVVMANRKKLMPIFFRGRATVGKKEVSLKNDVLRVSNQFYTVDNIDTLEGELHPRCFTRKTGYGTTVFGGVLSAYEPLSNWGKYPVTYNGTTYPTLEHAFVYQKCVINQNRKAADKVLGVSEPYEAKQIGQSIKLNKTLWTHQASEQVMAKLLEAKFKPGSELANELLKTGDNHLAESGRDQFYACGLPMTHKDIYDAKAHTGQNRLGKLLMNLRLKLRN